MNNTSPSLKNELFASYREVFLLLQEVFRQHHILYYLIGAQARNLHLVAHHIRPARVTNDIDFAIMVQDTDQYHIIMQALTEKGFEPSAGEPYRLLWKPTDTIVDLLPYGQMAQHHTVRFQDRNIELSVMGFEELQDALEEHYIDADQSVSIPVSPLHGIFLLKLLSWDDKKPDRRKDLDDMYLILRHYWTFVENEAYEQHTDLFHDDFDTQRAAARILGRHLSAVLKKSAVLYERITRILAEQSTPADEPGLLLQAWGHLSSKDMDTLLTLLDEIRAGIDDI